MTGFSLTQVLSSIVTPTACNSPPIIGCVAGLNSFSVVSSISPIPVPKTAALIRHSATFLRIMLRLKSASKPLRNIIMSAVSVSAASSRISNHFPRPKVASSSSATDDSTACCKAGEIILERSDCLVLSSAAQCPRHKR